jgi:Lrp/AsnC family transcriptional regulator, leucine-responsive regulatory protein
MTAHQVPEILTCHMMAGGYDYLLKIRSKDVGAYRALHHAGLTMVGFGKSMLYVKKLE